MIIMIMIERQPAAVQLIEPVLCVAPQAKYSGLLAKRLTLMEQSTTTRSIFESALQDGGGGGGGGGGGEGAGSGPSPSKA